MTRRTRPEACENVMSWGPEWKEAAREYHALRGPGRRLSKSEWEQWRREAGFDDGRAADSHKPQREQQQRAAPQTEMKREDP